MGGVGEHVDGLDGGDFVVFFCDVIQVSLEGFGVAGDVDDFLW